MTFKLKSLPSALKEWKKLDHFIQVQLKKKLSERSTNSHVPGSSLSGFEDHYKIKLRSSGYRMVYEVIEKEVVVLVIAVAKREKNRDYKRAQQRRMKD